MCSTPGNPTDEALPDPADDVLDGFRPTRREILGRGEALCDADGDPGSSLLLPVLMRVGERSEEVRVGEPSESLA